VKDEVWSRSTDVNWQPGTAMLLRDACTQSDDTVTSLLWDEM